MRKPRLTLALLAAAVVLGVDDSFAAEGDLDGSFAHPGVINEHVSAIAVDPQGRIIIGGGFSIIGASTKAKLARLNSDGSLEDTSTFKNVTFAGSSSGSVLAIGIQTDGRIVAGGRFTTVNNESHAKIARLNPDGSLDSGFSVGLSADVYAIAVHPTTVITNADRTLTAATTINADLTVPLGKSITLPADTTLLNGSRLAAETVLAVGTVPPTTTVLVSDVTLTAATILPTGTQLQSGNVLPANTVLLAGTLLPASTILPVGTIVAANTVLPTGTTLPVGTVVPAGTDLTSGSPLVADETLSSATTLTHNTTLGGAMTVSSAITLGGAMTLVSNMTLAGSVSLPGAMTLVANNSLLTGTVVRAGTKFPASVALPYVAKISTLTTLTADLLVKSGSVLTASSLIAEGTVLPSGTLVPAGVSIPSDRIWVGGSFGLVYIDNTPLTGTVVNQLPQLVINGTATGEVYALAVQYDGKVVIGGKFDRIGTTARRNIARLNPDGGLDSSFKADTDASKDTDGSGTKSVASSVFALGVQADGKVLVGGYFVSINGTSRKYFARLKTTGAVDTSFDAQVAGGVMAMAVDHDGEIVIGGEFTSVKGKSRFRLAKLTSSGALKSTFATGTNGIVWALAQTSDGSVLAGGAFTGVGTTSTQRLARFSNATTADVAIYGVVDEAADEISLRLSAQGAVPQFDSVTFYGGSSSLQWLGDYDPVSVNSAGMVKRTLVDGKPVWTLKLTGRTEAVGSTFQILALCRQTQNAAGSSMFGFGTASTNKLLAKPTIEFAASTATVAESQTLTTLTATLNVTGIIPSELTIPVSFGGSASQTADYTSLLSEAVVPVSASSATNTTATTVSLNVLKALQDRIIETAGETATFLLSPSALDADFVKIGTASTFTVTITDDDLAPVILTQPVGGLYFEGDNASMGINITANGTAKQQWYKNGSAITGATGLNYTLSKLKLTNAGLYTVQVTNDAKVGTNFASTGSTPGAVVGVVTKTDSYNAMADGTSITLSAFVSSPSGLTFQWKKDGLPLANSGVVSGATTASLILTNAHLADSGTYTCEVKLTQPGVGGAVSTLVAGNRVIAVVSGAPEFLSGTTLADGRVGTGYSQALPLNPDLAKTPATVTVTGLPPGLKFNPGTRFIEGVPTRSGTATVTMTASNLLNASTPAIQTRTLLIQAIPASVVGQFAVLLQRDGSPDGIGGRADFTTTAAGKITGAVVVQGVKRPFAGKLTGGNAVSDPFTATVPMASFAGDPTPSVVINFGAGGPDYVTLTLVHATLSHLGEGWRKVWSAANPATTRAGRHNFGSSLSSPHPEGGVAGTFNVSTTGNVVISGTLGDDSSIASSSPLGPAGEVLVFKPLYGNKGSVTGGDTLPKIAASGTVPSVSGELKWSKAETPTLANYKAAFGPVAMSITGSLYSNPGAGNRVMNLGGAATNLNIGISQSDESVAISVGAYVDTANKVVITTAGNPNKVSLTLNASTGLFTGSFIIPANVVDPERTAKFHGVFWPVTGSGDAYGHFMLNNLYSPGIDSAKLSGLVRLIRVP